MNKLILVGNLTRDPELRATPSGVSVCNFDIAVNERRAQQNGQSGVTYFRVTAWRQTGENCAKYLAKGRKVFVSGPVSASVYQTRNGETRVQLEVTAEDVAFLSSRSEAEVNASESAYRQQEREAIQNESSGSFQQVEADELPY